MTHGSSFLLTFIISRTLSLVAHVWQLAYLIGGETCALRHDWCVREVSSHFPCIVLYCVHVPVHYVLPTLLCRVVRIILCCVAQYATAEKAGEPFMTANDFVCKFLGIYTEDNANKDSIKLLGGILDTSKDGLISYAEFSAFEGLLCVPDALYRTAFQLFDTMGTGLVSHGKG